MPATLTPLDDAVIGKVNKNARLALLTGPRSSQSNAQGGRRNHADEGEGITQTSNNNKRNHGRTQTKREVTITVSQRRDEPPR